MEHDIYSTEGLYKIVEKADLSATISKHVIYAPLIATKAKAGHFVILRSRSGGERIPVTLVDWSPENGTVTVIIQAIGKSTSEMNALKAGDSFSDVAGPLGTPVEIKKYGTVLGVGGGVGIAELYPIARAFKQAGNEVVSILGARSKDLLILEAEMASLGRVIVTTDDGSAGKKGLVTDAMKELYAAGEKLDAIFTIGPIIMMKFVAEASRPHATPTFASLNPVMLDGTGMCGGCRVEISGKPKFACVDGPMFDAHQTNFDALMKRTAAYREQEKESLEKYGKDHQCRIGLH
ncbi:MAG: ferredoxin-NADP reductase [Elusimicrobia bacterium GWA2_62_23]|nr:MAG: ferredoxin-NADP reductase [Elusimicrobia bacterium GWA2_62_23]OGR68203.1 MAG: ferredoxin-NADP reductase [Elusimicrobia bacterium GWC2_63_65]